MSVQILWGRFAMIMAASEFLLFPSALLPRSNIEADLSLARLFLPATGLGYLTMIGMLSRRALSPLYRF